jgi:bisphosphoglycerate-dependent phosphoglycerate mutase
VYGSLQGLNKAETALKYGEKQVRSGEEAMKQVRLGIIYLMKT